MAGLMYPGGDPRKKDWIYYLAKQSEQNYIVTGNSEWLSSINDSHIVFKKKGKIRVQIYLKTEGENYTVYVRFNGSNLIYSSGHDGDKSYNNTLSVTSGNYIDIYVSRGYSQKLAVCIHEE